MPENRFFSFDDICRAPLGPLSVRTWQRLTLCACLEQSTANLTENPILRRQDLTHALSLSHVLSDKNPLQRAVLLEQLCVELACCLAASEERGPLKRMLDYMLSEDLDHLYRLANLMEHKGLLPAELLTGGYIEIMPGHPTAASHLHPCDAVHTPCPLSPLGRVRALLFCAAAENARAHYLSFCTGTEERALFSEFALIEDQHVSLLKSLLPPMEPAEELLLYQYAEYCLYESFARQETDLPARSLLLHFAEEECGHLTEARRLYAIQTGYDADEALPASFSPVIFSGWGDYARDALLRNADAACVRGEVIPVRLLPDGCDYFVYQDALGPHSPSHLLLEQQIACSGGSYRFTRAHHPLESLQSRTRDPVRI